MAIDYFWRLYIQAWASALLVLTCWAMPEPLYVGRVTGRIPRSFCISVKLTTNVLFWDSQMYKDHLPMKHLKLLTVMFFSLLLGTIPLMAQEDGTKCVMIETSQGETLEYYISSHPRLTQNNDKVTLTVGEETTEFGTVDIKKVYTSIATIKVVYMLDGVVYKTYYHHAGVALKPEPAPTKEGYSFSGWDNEPTTMPDHDITIAGTFNINKYKLTYIVDDVEYKSFDIEFGVTITPEAEPTKEGYTFSGWSEIPETMPAHDVTITGTFAINSYKLTYQVDGEVYKSSDVEFGTTIIPEAEPKKEGYTFSGWSEIPETMPAHDVTITGTFSINSYKLTYTVDDVEYKSFDIEYGAAITPEAEPEKEGYTFSGWSEIPATMPAHDVTVTGTFAINKYKLTYKVDGEVYKTYDVEYGATITPEAAPEKEGYTFSGWSEIPEKMPSHDVTVTGTFAVNKYKLTYKVDGEVYKTYDVEYGATITPEPAPTKEGYTFSGWSDIPTTMPAHDVTVTGTFTINSGIDIINMNANIVKSRHEIYLSGLQPNEKIYVYGLSGELIFSRQASKEGELTISTSELTQGAYIIKTNRQTFKITRK